MERKILVEYLDDIWLNTSYTVSKVHMHLKLPHLFLIVITGGMTFSGLLIFTYISGQPKPYLESPPAESAVIGMYANEMDVYYLYMYMGNTKKLQVKIKYFSKELKLLTLDNKTIEAPYLWQVKVDEMQFEYWGFRIIAPTHPGDYEINLRITVSNWLSSQTYPQKITVRVEPLKYS